MMSSFARLNWKLFYFLINTFVSSSRTR